MPLVIQALGTFTPNAQIALVIGLILVCAFTLVIMIAFLCWIVKSPERTRNICAIIRELASWFKGGNNRDKGTR